MKRMLCLWFPNWPIQRLVVAEPTLRKTHLVLFRRDPRKGQLVAAASPLAMLSGAQIDMPISEVKQLMRHSGLSRQTWRPNHRLHPRDQHRQLAKQAVAMVSSGQHLEPVKHHPPSGRVGAAGEGADGKPIHLETQNTSLSPPLVPRERPPRGRVINGAMTVRSISSNTIPSPIAKHSKNSPTRSTASVRSWASSKTILPKVVSLT